MTNVIRMSKANKDRNAKVVSFTLGPGYPQAIKALKLKRRAQSKSKYVQGLIWADAKRFGIENGLDVPGWVTTLVLSEVGIGDRIAGTDNVPPTSAEIQGAGAHEQKIDKTLLAEEAKKREPRSRIKGNVKRKRNSA